MKKLSSIVHIPDASRREAILHKIDIIITGGFQ